MTFLCLDYFEFPMPSWRGLIDQRGGNRQAQPQQVEMDIHVASPVSMICRGGVCLAWV
jgi:hypothetical protein